MYSPSPGVIYPTLTLLEELGYIRPDSAEGPRKQFVITPEGAAFLAANKAVVDQIFARMAEVSHVYAGGPAPEIRRAMHNLEAALTISLGRGPDRRTGARCSAVRTVPQAGSSRATSRRLQCAEHGGLPAPAPDRHTTWLISAMSRSRNLVGDRLVGPFFLVIPAPGPRSARPEDRLRPGSISAIDTGFRRYDDRIGTASK